MTGDAGEDRNLAVRRLTLRMAFDSPETREAMIRFGAVEGGESTLNCLDAYLARNRAALSGAA
ncbi:MAG: hypothetical protein WD270_05380 [Acetobacterales bacterium]